MHHLADSDALQATFSPSAFMDGRSVQCSGGPSEILFQGDLVPTGQTIEQSFWRWRSGKPGADEAEYFQVEVPLWSWKGQQQGILEGSREPLEEALGKLGVIYPDNGRRKDCAYLTLQGLSTQDVPYISGHGFISSPYPRKEEFFHAQMALGTYEIMGCGVGETWDDAIQDLKASLLEAFDIMRNLSPTDPMRVKHSSRAALGSADSNSMYHSMEEYLERSERLVARELERVGQRVFECSIADLVHAGQGGSVYEPVGDSRRMAARSAAEALKLAFGIDVRAPRKFSEADHFQVDRGGDLRYYSADIVGEPLRVPAKENRDNPW